jgi:alkylhydroperoxidase family enzyme
MTNKLVPLSEPFPPDIAEILENYPRQDGYLLTLFRTFANSRRFLSKGVPNLLDRDSPLPLRLREIVILRTTANRNCEYEWGVHVTIFAMKARLSDAQINATRQPSICRSLWSETEATLIEAIDQLCRDGMLSGKTLVQFETDWTAEQQLEILALCGTYNTVSFVANVARLENEPFAAKFPTRSAG